MHHSEPKQPFLSIKYDVKGVLFALRPDVCQILWVLIALSPDISVNAQTGFLKNNQHPSKIGFEK